MGIWQFVFLILAGMAAGFVGYSVGLASLVSFPATLAVGVPPVMSSATNTAGNVGVTIGGCLGARPELRARRQLAIIYACLGLAGGVIGAILLLKLPAKLFEYSVPPFIAISALLILIRPKKGAEPARDGEAPGVPAKRDPGRNPLLLAALSLLSVYSGYFGAGAGTATLAVLSVGKVGPYAQINALKTIGSGCGNISATIVFMATGMIHWPAMIALFIGSTIGSRLAPAVVRRVPEGVMRTIACVAGLVLSVYLGIRYYG
ncbi:sulfite exporter TauE/SafE family protein [Bifidobacterium vespertilionis]|uniref:Probable membrane transporter protein n=1 Tax=Bifidobacterium vespertilionis TaxID=2562524 RepID=A0A5J5DT73_9BIFI|nr:sulfite exporter TauE/SafE family protein [Bifidobacterium vespertilionis]KAA8816998.1 sulfite exporter TauE/SafE family protein [Bifidobacterium vespertilionis]KAA8823770.1 sulfite exporter TauE/SafE family protein [Bifidobacterium vespertilionis]